MQNSTEKSATVVLDIEGTITPITFVKDVLFPFARGRAGAFLAEHENDNSVAVLRAGIAHHGGVDSGDLGAVVGVIEQLIDDDVKQTDLKSLQGRIWREGYESGELLAPMFDDVPPYLRRSGPVYIYSSGSIAAQKLLLAHTKQGDLTAFIADYFDTTSGQKVDSTSYEVIARSLPDGPIWFGSDNPLELHAAANAGWNVALFVRPGNPATDEDLFPRVDSMESFEDLFG